MNVLALSLVAALTVSVAPDGNDANDGVANPVRNVSRAVELTRRAASGPKTIRLKEGVHRIDGPVELDGRDAGLSIVGADGGRTVLTGARRVTGWKRDAEDPGVLVAPFPFEPGEWRMPTLVVNGRAADLAAYPQYGGERRMRYFAEESDAAKGNRTVITYDIHDLPKGTSFRDLDISSAFLYVPQEWCSSLCRIATNDWRHDTFVLRDRTDMPIGRFNQGYQVVNTRLGMDRAGRWMFEAAKRRILYRPRPGEDAATLKAELSCAERLFNLTNARDIRFAGLVLEGCSKPFRRTKGDLPPACIAGQAVTNVVVESCEVRHASGDGLYFSREANVSVRRCHFHDLGGGGIWLGYFGETGEVSDCHVHHNGRLSLGSAGVWAHMSHLSVVRNHVHDQPGCGLTLWICHSLVASNHLHHTMRAIRDGGALYGAQNFSMIRDNYLHDLGDWSGLYNDEGGRDSVYTGNRVEGCWWPFHMHDTYGVVVSNNVFTCDGCAMRFSFQGSTHAIFMDNVINTTIPITDDAYLENCDIWAVNDVRLKQADGTYRSVGRLSLEKKPAPPKDPAQAVRRPGAGRIRMDRDGMGLATPGVPGASASLSFDDEKLYVEGAYEYNKFIHYDGSVTLGDTWGKHDAVRFEFGDFTVTAFIGGGVVSSDPTLVLDPSNTYSRLVKSVWDGGARFGFAVPLKRLGVEGRGALGKEIPFNAVSYNNDHREFKWFVPPPSKANRARGRLVFAPALTNFAAKVDRRVRRADGFCDLPGPTVPGGAAQAAPDTADRPDEGYADHAAGYDVRHAELLGFVQCGDAALRGFLLQPFTGSDPDGAARLFRHVEKASEVSRAGLYGISVENWALRTELTASAFVAWQRFHYDRGGRLKVLLDTQAVAPHGRRGPVPPAEVTASESSLALADGTFAGHVRATVDGRAADLWCAMAFDPKPVAMRELADNGRCGKRYVLEFDLRPISGAVVVKSAVSAKSATEAAERLASDGYGFDFDGCKAVCEVLWNRVLEKEGK